jgi:hypothetical protein
MTFIPTIIVDDFLDDGIRIKEYALKQDFNVSSPRWPGKRTECLSKINYTLYNSIILKTLKLFSPTNILDYQVEMFFQKIDSDYGQGWVHQDKEDFTMLLNLTESDEDINYGTSFYKLKDPIANDFSEQYDLMIGKGDNLENNNLEKYREITKEHNSKYEKVVDVRGQFNRLLCFDSNLFHAANSFKLESGERLSLIAFFKNIVFDGDTFPIIRSNTINHYGY